MRICWIVHNWDPLLCAIAHALAENGPNEHLAHYLLPLCGVVQTDHHVSPSVNLSIFEHTLSLFDCTSLHHNQDEIINDHSPNPRPTRPVRWS